MDKEIRLGRFDKLGYKNSFSKGELARELTYMNRDYDKLEQQCKKQKEVIDKIKDLLTIKKLRCLNENDYILNVLDLDDILDIVEEVSE